MIFVSYKVDPTRICNEKKKTDDWYRSFVVKTEYCRRQLVTSTEKDRHYIFSIVVPTTTPPHVSTVATAADHYSGRDRVMGPLHSRSRIENVNNVRENSTDAIPPAAPPLENGRSIWSAPGRIPIGYIRTGNVTRITTLFGGAQVSLQSILFRFILNSLRVFTFFTLIPLFIRLLFFHLLSVRNSICNNIIYYLVRTPLIPFIRRHDKTQSALYERFACIHQHNSATRTTRTGLKRSPTITR